MPYTVPQSLSDDTLLREALQARLLAELFSNTIRHELVLKGGMAMRLAFGSVRYTKDIDLESPPEEHKAHVQAIVKQSIARVMAEGLLEDPVISAPKQTDTTLRWKIGGRIPGGVSEVHLTVEVSRRGNIPPNHVIKIPLTAVPGGSPVLIDVYDGEAIAAAKVFALTSPNRVAPRDLYDLSVLIDLKIQPPLELLARRGKEKVEAALKELWFKIEAMTWDEFDKQVIPFLPPAMAARFDASSFSEMQIKVGTAVEGWLNETKKRMAP